MKAKTPAQLDKFLFYCTPSNIREIELRLEIANKVRNILVLIGKDQDKIEKTFKDIPFALGHLTKGAVNFDLLTIAKIELALLKLLEEKSNEQKEKEVLTKVN